MSLDVVSDVAAPVADSPASHDIEPVERIAPFVLPSPSGGYAGRSTLRSKVFALVITMAIHVAAVLGILLYRSPGVFVAPPPEPLTVTLLLLARPPAETDKKEQKPKTVPTPTSPALTSPIERPIVPNMIGPTDAAPDETPPAPPAPPAPQAGPAPATSAAPASDAPGNAQDNWEGRVLARLERSKRFPAAARSRREQGVVTIRFRLDRHGHVLSSSIARSSGSRILDAEALATLERAEPLPPIPPGRPDEIEILVPIEFFMRPGV